MRSLIPKLALGLFLLASTEPASSEERWLPEPAIRALALESLESGEPGGHLQFEAALAPDEESFELMLAGMAISIVRAA